MIGLIFIVYFIIYNYNNCMKSPTITTCKKYLIALKKVKGKYVTSERLSKVVGIYPEIINETFSYFDPMVNMDYQYNLRDLEKPIEDYIEKIEEEKIKKPNKETVTKKKLEEYSSIGDFIYKKMTIAGGILDKSAYFSDYDLRVLKKLIIEEQHKRKKN